MNEKKMIESFLMQLQDIKNRRIDKETTLFSFPSKAGIVYVCFFFLRFASLLNTFWIKYTGEYG